MRSGSEFRRGTESASAGDTTVDRHRPQARALTVALAGALAASLGLGTTAAAADEPPACQPASAGGPVFVTETCIDPSLSQPYTDLDEQRTLTDPATNVTVNYRYIHGGFTGTNAKFALYFPASATYKGRFFQSTYPTVTHEDADPTALAFSLSNGAYVVQTNNGGGVAAAGGLGGYRINAAAAKYSRVVAAGVYPNSARPRGHIYGVSGGAYQTIGAAENTDRVWDGAVPGVPGTPNGIPSYATVELLALRVLRDKLPQIVDAMEPGGSGRPYVGLSDEQRRVLREATLLGFPLRGWWNHETLDGASIALTGAVVRFIDGSYQEDFWTKPGYAGTDPAESAAAARIQADTTVVGLVGTPTSRLVLSNVPTGYLTGSELIVTSGAASGRSVPLGTVTGDTVGFGAGADPSVTNAIRPGDQIRIDNSWFTALQYYHRYQVPTPDMYGWNQYRDSAGNPIHPQRPFLVGPILAGGAGGAAPTGRFNGKMIMVSSVLDQEAFAWSADWYKAQAKKALGGRLDDSYRLWFMDNAGHTPPPNTAAQTHIVNYDSAMQQALLDLDAWVKKGTPPPAGTRYRVSADTQVELPASAAQRLGVQPVVDVSVGRSGEQAQVKVGQPVTLSIDTRVAPGTGKIVKVEWDFAGEGTYPVQKKVDRPVVNDLIATHTFSEPGVYFPVVRVTSRRDGDANPAFGLVQNVDRVRVVVVR